MNDMITKEEPITKKDVIEAMKEVIAPLVKDVAAIKNDVAVLKTDVAVLKTDVAAIKVEQKRMDKELREIKHELAKKPDRDEVRLIVQDELKNNTAIYILDRGGFEGLIIDWLDKNLKAKIKEVLKQEKLIK
ncbi:MAG: hypothetical protein HQK92_08055 [Nitrospirae bacterium]|nr:hypothetical protein [Nitrospirota bacterium]